MTWTPFLSVTLATEVEAPVQSTCFCVSFRMFIFEKKKHFFLVRPAPPLLHTLLFENTNLIWKHHFTWKWLSNIFPTFLRYRILLDLYNYFTTIAPLSLDRKQFSAWAPRRWTPALGSSPAEDVLRDVFTAWGLSLDDSIIGCILPI